MSFNWVEFIELSEKLIDNFKDQASFRTSISRAYYGAFCLARDKKQINSSDKNVHKIVIEIFQKSNNINEKKIGKILFDLRKARNEADYQTNKSFNLDDTKRMIQKSRKIINLLSNI
jgi:uncharacterized protein (UPF0332 family)